MVNGENLFKFIVEYAYDGIAVIDENQRINYANTELARILGYSKMEIIGQDFRKFLSKESRGLFSDEAIAEMISKHKQEKLEKSSQRYELTIIRKDGEKRTIDARTVTFYNLEGGIRTLAQVRDITDVKRLEAEKSLYKRRLSELNNYAIKLNSAEDLKTLFRLTLDAMEKILGFKYASIFLVEGNNLRMVAQRGYPEPPRLVLPLDGEMGIAVRAARTARSVNVPDVRIDPAYVKTKDDMLSELAVPMKVGNKVVGVLNVESYRLNAFTEDDRKLLEVLASQTAVAISNIRRRENLAAINTFGRSIIKVKSINEILEKTLDTMQELLGLEKVDIFLVEGDKLKLAAARGLEQASKFELDLREDAGITVKAAKERMPVYVPDVRKEKAYVKCGSETMLSELAVPIKLGNNVLGVLNVESDKAEAFDEDDVKKLEILASNLAVAISNIRRQESLAQLSKKLEHLVKSCIHIMQVKNMRDQLKAIARSAQNLGWNNATVILFDENLKVKEAATVGPAEHHIKLFSDEKFPGRLWKELFDYKFDRFKFGEFYYLPWSDPVVRDYIGQVSPDISSRLEDILKSHVDDLLYAPLRTREGKIIGVMTIEVPSGIKPTDESLIPLELLVHYAVIAIENTMLIEGLEKAREELKEYAGQLEKKVEERTRTIIEFQDKLLKAQRLAAIGELASMIGHDLRNPLTGISNAAYYIKKRLAKAGVLDEQIAGMINVIERDIMCSNKIINDLLDYSKELRLELTETNPRKIVEEALSAVEIPANIQVVNMTNHDVKFIADFEKMKRIFINLIKNAVDAMPNGGTLTIQSRKKEENVEFTVSDTGVGMPKEVLGRLWSPLVTTKAKGMGFGLAICKRFVDAHEGAINVESAPGKGTTFTLTFPIKPKKEEGGENFWLKKRESSLLTTTKT